MNWKILGKALLTTCVVFAFIAIIFLIGYYIPWLTIGFIFIGTVIIVYNSMKKSDYDYSDNDRIN